MNRNSILTRSFLIAGFGFLYVPLIILVIYSFNDSRFVTVWGGFSTKWYMTLLNDSDLIAAFFNSLRIATISATIATLFGVVAGFVLHKFAKFTGKSLFSGLISLPFIMPEIMIGFSLLLLFVTLNKVTGWPSERGMLTVILAHSTVGIAYVTVIIQARLSGFDTSLEEAALDLGATPVKVFFSITLPLLLPGIISGWLLAFTLSIDDLVIASFTSGPTSVTLPMMIYSKVRFGVSPEINALATLTIAAVMSIAIIVYIVNNDKKK